MVGNEGQLHARRTKCLNYRFSSNSTHSAAVSLFWRFQGPGKPRFHDILKSILYLRQDLQFTPQKEVQVCQPGWKNNPATSKWTQGTQKIANRTSKRCQRHPKDFPREPTGTHGHSHALKVFPGLAWSAWPGCPGRAGDKIMKNHR